MIINGHRIRPIVILAATLQLFSVTVSYSQEDTLLTTTWHQVWPYNMYCPEDSSGNTNSHANDHAVTGCSSVAFAQLCNFHRFPTKYPEVTDKTAYGTFSIEPDMTPFDYEQMALNTENIDDSAAIRETARLINRTGIVLRTQYGPKTSSVNNYHEFFALFHLMKFSAATRVRNRVNFKGDTASWIALLVNEIDNHRPVLYSAGSRKFIPNHLFILDGYQTLEETVRFHCNWGLDNWENAFYPLDTMILYDTLMDDRHLAVTNITPPKHEAPTNFSITYKSGTSFQFSWDKCTSPEIIGYGVHNLATRKRNTASSTSTNDFRAKGADLNSISMNLVNSMTNFDTAYFSCYAIGSDSTMSACSNPVMLSLQEYRNILPIATTGTFRHKVSIASCTWIAPARQIHVELSGRRTTSPVRFHIVNGLGQTVVRGTSLPANNKVRINAPGISRGTYFICIKAGPHSLSRELVVY